MIQWSTDLVLKDIVFLIDPKPHSVDEDLTELKNCLSKMKSNSQRPFSLERKAISLIGRQTKN